MSQGHKIDPLPQRKTTTMRNDFEDVMRSLSLDGTSETLGSCERYGRHWTRLEGPITVEEILRAAADMGVELEPGEAEEWSADAVGGAIVTETDSGFVDVDTYATREELEMAWSDVEAEIQERDDEARAELARQVDNRLPLRFSVRFAAFSGCSPSPVSFESLEEAREYLRSNVERDRKLGFVVSELGPDRWEVTDPDTALMASDQAGVYSIESNEEERAAALERAEEMYL